MPTSNAPETPAADASDAKPASAGKADSASASKPKQTRARAKSAKNDVAKVHKPTSGNPAWLVPTMLALLILGLLWVVVYYLTSAHWVWPTGNWNIAYGFGLILAGGVLSTRYK